MDHCLDIALTHLVLSTGSSTTFQILYVVCTDETVFPFQFCINITAWISSKAVLYRLDMTEEFFHGNQIKFKIL